MIKKTFLIAGKVLLGVIGVWAALLVLVEILLSPPVTSKIVNKVAAEYIDGNLEFTKARISLFKRFPSIYVDIEDFSLTYPSERFDEEEKSSPQGWLLYQGGGETSDTLASFKSFKASVRIFPLLKGDIKIPYLNLDTPRIFAHQYGETQANWNMFKLSSEEEEEQEDTLSGFPSLTLGKISLSNQPHIVYTDSRDTLFALLRLKSFDFNGRIANRKISHNHIEMSVDSLVAAGRLGQDTIAFGMQTLKVGEKGSEIEIHTKARTLVASKALGRLDIPILLDGRVSFPKDSVFAVSVKDFNAEIATVPIQMQGDLRFFDNHLSIKANAGVNNCNLNGLLKGLCKNIIPHADQLSTNSMLSIDLICDGDYIYETGKLPKLTLSADIPKSSIYHSGFDERVSLALNLKGEVDNKGKVRVNLNKTNIATQGLSLEVSGKVSDLLGDDPALEVKGNATAFLSDLTRFIPDSLQVNATGDLTADIEGSARLSQLNLYNFSDAQLNGHIQGEGISIEMPSEALKADFDLLNIKLGPEDLKSRRDTTKSKRMLSLDTQIDSINIVYSNLKATGKNLSLTAKSSAEILQGGDKIHHLGGILSAQRLDLDDGQGSRLVVRNTSNGFQVVPDMHNEKAPVFTVTSRNNGIFLRSGVQRASLKDAKIIATANMNHINREAGKRGKKNISRSRNRGDIPEWMKEEDFRKQDINIKLDEELAKYFRKWNFRGRLEIGSGNVMSPFFPLRNRLNGFRGKFSSNEITIDEFHISSGKSEICANGKLSGLSRMLSGRRGGMLKFDCNINSEKIDVDQLIRAYNAGVRFDEKKNGKKLEKMSDEEYSEAILLDTADVEPVPISTIVVPGNLNANIKLDTRNIKYTGLQVDTLRATLVIKERCVQITDTEAKTNVGDISFDGFYSTQSKKNIKAGFSVDFEDITAEKVIALMPAIDTLMPVLKSFEGLLNCEIAATTQLDTNMNLILPSIDGIMRITGDDLAVKNNPMFRKLARKLLFKNKKEGHVEHMSVEGVISDNVVEIFPFVLKMDRYTLALSGIQNLDMSYKYHVSLIKSPFLIRLGLDISGPDFDNMKFRIGRAKYKSPDVPVFSKVIDDTKVNLVTSIEDIFKKGVDATMRENRGGKLIRLKQREMKYVRAVDQELESLSEEEEKQVAEEEARQAEEERLEAEASQNQAIDSTSVQNIKPENENIINE